MSSNKRYIVLIAILILASCASRSYRNPSGIGNVPQYEIPSISSAQYDIKGAPTTCSYSRALKSLYISMDKCRTISDWASVAIKVENLTASINYEELSNSQAEEVGYWIGKCAARLANRSTETVEDLAEKAASMKKGFEKSFSEELEEDDIANVYERIERMFD